MPRSPAGRRLRSALSVRSVAGQVFVFQMAAVVLLVVGAVIFQVLQARHDSIREARNRSVSVAHAFANSPGIQQALKAKNPAAILQPRTEAARKLSGVDFIVVMNTHGVSYTHPEPNRIGHKFVGNTESALHGKIYTEPINGTMEPLVQAVVPVHDSHHKVVGLVSSGIMVKNVDHAVDRQLPVLLGTAATACILATGGTALVSRRLRRQTRGLGPAEITRMYEHHDAVLRAVREGVLIVGGDHRLLLANDEARRLLDLPPDAEGRLVTELGLDPNTSELLTPGRVATDEVYPAGDRLLAINHEPTDRNGGPPGSVVTIRDSTELRAVSGKAETARQRLGLLYDARVGIGTTLDVKRTVQELADVAVPQFADFATVDLADAVLHDEEPVGASTEMRRTAVSGIRSEQSFCPLGELIRGNPSTPQAWEYGSGEAVLERDLARSAGLQAQDPVRTRKIVDAGMHSLITVPLRARDTILGVANFWRSEKPEPFDDEDLPLAEELVARAALAIDNARRYTREYAMAATLQRSLLPRTLPEQSALDVAHRYLPAQAGVSGDWFDVIPLTGARVALVVGDVVGHGLHAAAAMGRLRTAVRNFSALDMPPDELLGHLDELVDRIDRDEAGAGGGAGITGVTCLYAIYDPVSRICSIARAGHFLPALVHPSGEVEFPDVPVGLPLGLGSMPFETAELLLEEGSQLVLYTDGLVEDRERDIDTGLELLRRALADSAAGTGADRADARVWAGGLVLGAGGKGLGHTPRGGSSPDETCDAVLKAMLPDHPRDDIALLVARTQVLGPDQVAAWDVPSAPEALSQVRAAVVQQLASWGLDELAFSTELLLSELITNAILHASGPIRVRMLRERSLICEVSDTSNVAPHLRRAAALDEGGRGLFLVAQVTERWGTRYTPEGKVIWTEQPLP